MHAPVSITTPTVDKPPPAKEITEKYLTACYEKLPFALRTAAAEKQIADRAANFTDDLFKEVTYEPVIKKKRVK